MNETTNYAICDLMAENGNLKTEISRLQGENERLTREVNYNCKNEIAPCPLLVTAEQRVARECAEIVEGYIGCDQIASIIKAKYGL